MRLVIWLVMAALCKANKLCTESNTQKKICTVKDRLIRLHADLNYTTVNTIVFINTELVCITKDNNPCTISLSSS